MALPFDAAAAAASARRQRILPYVALAGVICLWGLGPPVSKLITGPTTTIVAVRMWLAAPLALAVQRATGTKIKWSTIRRAWKGGVFFGLNMLFFFTAIRHVSVATMTLVGVMQPIIVSLVSVKMFGEKLSRWWAAWTVVAIGGVAIAVLTAGKTVRGSPFGLFMSLMMVVLFSAYIIVTRSARATMGPNEYLSGVMIWAAILVTIPVLFQGLDLGELSGRDWFWIGVMLIGPGWLGHFLLNWVIVRLPMSITALQGLPSTVVSIALAWPIHQETITVAQGFAGVLTLVAVGMIVHGPFHRKRA